MNIWMASAPIACALSIALSSPPAVETWAPTFMAPPQSMSWATQGVALLLRLNGNGKGRRLRSLTTSPDSHTMSTWLAIQMEL